MESVDTYRTELAELNMGRFKQKILNFAPPMQEIVAGDIVLYLARVEKSLARKNTQLDLRGPALVTGKVCQGVAVIEDLDSGARRRISTDLLRKLNLSEELYSKLKQKRFELKEGQLQFLDYKPIEAMLKEKLKLEEEWFRSLEGAEDTPKIVEEGEKSNTVIPQKLEEVIQRQTKRYNLRDAKKVSYKE